eukprot:UN07886
MPDVQTTLYEQESSLSPNQLKEHLNKLSGENVDDEVINLLFELFNHNKDDHLNVGEYNLSIRDSKKLSEILKTYR